MAGISNPFNKLAGMPKISGKGRRTNQSNKALSRAPEASAAKSVRGLLTRLLMTGLIKVFNSANVRKKTGPYK